jgi:hypothetical protein
MEQDKLSNKVLALLLFAGERADDSGPDELQDAVQRTFEKLSVHLARRIGSAGYRALLKRAVAVAATDFPWLVLVSVSENGTLGGFGTEAKGRDTSETADACVAILASLIGLLETFIGRTLCFRVLHDVWPGELGIEARDSHGDNNG